MRTIPYVRYCVFACVIAVIVMLAMPASSVAQVSVGITVGFAPPDLPVYEQPICPEEGYIWTPGYWAWDEDDGDYYWVPGTWVQAPEVGFLWTPAYWAWGGSGFVFYEGYWSYQVVGFYGGIDYGYGYFGHGYEGGRWDRDHFFYNRSVNNVNVTIIHNVYEAPVNVRNGPRVSYNGGDGGINERPRPEEEAAAHARHIPPVPPQRQHVQEARSNPQLRSSVNRGKPPIAATSKPAAFNDRGVVPAREAGAIHHPAPGTAGPGNAGRGNAGPGNNPSRAKAVHPNELPPVERPGPPNTGNPKQDQKYQKQQEKLFAQQEKDRQKLQQQQEKDHQQLAKQNADEARKQQVEQRHQQQTEQLQQKHSQQQQKMQQRRPQPRSAPPPPKEKH
jgi:WXXGXW repeat (2 copies)